MVACFDTTGVSHQKNNNALLDKERDEVCRELFPPRVYADYKLKDIYMDKILYAYHVKTPLAGDFKMIRNIFKKIIFDIFHRCWGEIYEPSIMKLSIITINLNNREWLELTVKSVVNQSTQDFEYIIIDGGSTDGSDELIRKYSNNIDFWVSEPDKGIYNAMNKGIQKANGEFCIFINSGDQLYDNEVIAQVLPLLNDKDFYTGNQVQLFEKPIIFEAPEYLTVAYLINSYLPHAATFIRTELLKKRAYSELLKISSDWEQMLVEYSFNDRSYQRLHNTISYFDATGVSSDKANEKVIIYERKQTIEKYFSKNLRDSIYNIPGYP